MNRSYRFSFGVICLIISGAFAFMAGWSHDAQCTLEQDNAGECNRQSDGTNAFLIWALFVSGTISVVSGFAGLTIIIMSPIDFGKL